MDKKYLNMTVDPCTTKKEAERYLFDIKKDKNYFIVTIYDEEREARSRSVCNKNEFANIIIRKSGSSFSVRPLNQVMVQIFYLFKYDSTRFNRETLTETTEQRIIHDFVNTFGLKENEEWYRSFVNIQEKIRNKRIYDKHLKVYKKAKAYE